MCVSIYMHNTHATKCLYYRGLNSALEAFLKFSIVIYISLIRVTDEIGLATLGTK